MWPLAALSVLAVAVVVERAVTFVRTGAQLEPLAGELDAALRRGDLESAREVVSDGRSVLAKVASAFLDAVPLRRVDREDIEIRREIGTPVFGSCVLLRAR